MHRFHIVPDAAAVIVRKSVYKQVRVFQRDGGVYVEAGGGFVRLYADGNTGVPDLRWDDIEIPGMTDKTQLKRAAHDRLSLPASAIKQIEGSVAK